MRISCGQIWPLPCFSRPVYSSYSRAPAYTTMSWDIVVSVEAEKERERERERERGREGGRVNHL
jgi:hypothetical protein